VSLNNLVVDGVLVATTPCFLGSDPFASPLLGGALNRPLGRLEDLARDLMRSLRPALAERALLLPRAPGDLVTGNRTVLTDGDELIPLVGLWRDERFPDDSAQANLQMLSDRMDDAAGLSPADHTTVAYSTSPRGAPAAEFDAEQRALLRALLSTYLDRVPAGISSQPAYDDDAALDAVHFAWAGTTDPGAPTYYRLQGPGLFLEWDKLQRNANHAHSVWRNPDADFGLDVLARHRTAHHS
jgi:hypothetical protein